MNRIEIDLFGKKFNLRTSEDPTSVLKAVEEVRQRGETIIERHNNNVNREDLFMVVSLNLAQELLKSHERHQKVVDRPEPTHDESR